MLHLDLLEQVAKLGIGAKNISGLARINTKINIAEMQGKPKDVIDKMRADLAAKQEELGIKDMGGLLGTGNQYTNSLTGKFNPAYASIDPLTGKPLEGATFGTTAAPTGKKFSQTKLGDFLGFDGKFGIQDPAKVIQKQGQAATDKSRGSTSGTKSDRDRSSNNISNDYAANQKDKAAAEKAGNSKKTTSLGGKTSVKGVKQEDVGKKLGRGGGFAKGGLMKKK